MDTRVRRILSVAGISKPNMLCQIEVPETTEALTACLDIGVFLFRMHLRQ